GTTNTTDAWSGGSLTPAIRKLPYISQLFRNVDIGRDTESLMSMVTPRIIIQQEEEERLGIATSDRPVDLDLLLQEAQTGRLDFGVGIDSDAGLVGNVVIDEQNFDSLIELITNTITPDAWEEVGGTGSIAEFEGNLSLVISSTESGDESYDTLDFNNPWLAVVLPVERSFIPFSDDPPMVYPSAEEWKELTRRRRKYSSIDIPKPLVASLVIDLDARVDLRRGIENGGWYYDPWRDEYVDQSVNGPWDVDNDRDGIADSVWIDIGAKGATDREWPADYVDAINAKFFESTLDPRLGVKVTMPTGLRKMRSLLPVHFVPSEVMRTPAISSASDFSRRATTTDASAFTRCCSAPEIVGTATKSRRSVKT
ncbi:MAG TPA: hypothetical protein VMX74_07800, partial [Pirellulales bacterium]|nr:hypothetical protein [Pirellulales bacterium]